MAPTTAAYDRLKIDDSNDGRRLGLEGGLGTGALVVTLVYLMYEALMPQPASATPAGGKEGIVKNGVAINPNLFTWRRGAHITKKNSTQETSDLANIDYNGVGNSTPELNRRLSNFSLSNNPDQPSISSPKSNTLPGAASNQESFFPPSNYLGRNLDNPIIQQTNSPYTYSTRPYKNNPSVNKLPSHLVIAVVNTNPNVHTSTIEGEAYSENSGQQYGINETSIVTRGEYDQIAAFSQRLSETTARSAQNDSIVKQVLHNAGINESSIDAQGYGGILVVSASDFIDIAQSSDLTLHTFVDQELAGIKHSDIDMTSTSDAVNISASTDIAFKGYSETNSWNQDISLKSVGLLGVETESDVSHNNGVQQESTSSPTPLAQSLEDQSQPQDQTQDQNQAQSLSLQSPLIDESSPDLSSTEALLPIDEPANTADQESTSSPTPLAQSLEDQSQPQDQTQDQNQAQSLSLQSPLIDESSPDLSSTEALLPIDEPANTADQESTSSPTPLAQSLEDQSQPQDQTQDQNQAQSLSLQSPLIDESSPDLSSTEALLPIDEPANTADQESTSSPTPLAQSLEDQSQPQDQTQDQNQAQSLSLQSPLIDESSPDLSSTEALLPIDEPANTADQESTSSPTPLAQSLEDQSQPQDQTQDQNQAQSLSLQSPLIDESSPDLSSTEALLPIDEPANTADQESTSSPTPLAQSLEDQSQPQDQTQDQNQAQSLSLQSPLIDESSPDLSSTEALLPIDEPANTADQESTSSPTPLAQSLEDQSQPQDQTQDQNQAQSLSLQSPLIDESSPDEQSVETIYSLESNPNNKLDLDNGNNILNVKANIGDNSSWNAEVSDLECECPDEASTTNNLNLSLEAVAVENYSILAGDGNDRITLQTSINEQLVEQWMNGFEELNDSNLTTDQHLIAMRRSFLYTGGGDDEIKLEGDIERSAILSGSGEDTFEIDGSLRRSYANSGNGNDSIFINGDIENSSISTGKGSDSLTLKGGIDDSTISMGGNNDVVLLLNPSPLTGKLLGGAGLDKLSFKGSSNSYDINANTGKINDLTFRSFELLEGGDNDDVLWASDTTIFMDGGAGRDLYVLQGETNHDNLALNLSVSNLLDADDGLICWNSKEDSLISQIGYQLGIDYVEGITLPDGAQLMPIGSLDTIMYYQGMDTPIFGTFAEENQWAIATDLPGTEGPSLIEMNSGLDKGYALIASLNNSNTSEGDSSA